MSQYNPNAVKLSNGNKNVSKHIKTSGSATMQEMWRDRHEQPQQVLYRVCSKVEANNTFKLCLAGGNYRDLTQIAPSEEQAVEQVSNNESMPSNGKPDPRLQKLLELQKQGVKVNLEKKKREVVEFSYRPATQFKGVLIKVSINQSFTVEGTGLEFEGGGGRVVQIGTPLSWVEIKETDLEE